MSNTDPAEKKTTAVQSPEQAARFLSQLPSAPLARGTQVTNAEDWVLEEQLGFGGFGEVWLARHSSSGERRAVKFCTHPVARQRLASHESNVVLHVLKHMQDHRDEHPLIVPLLECHLTGPVPWLMYEYISGKRTLEAVIEDAKALAPQERVIRASQLLHIVARAVGRLHHLKVPIVHRDLKPQNILMRGTLPCITDFGIGGTAVAAAVADTTGGLTELDVRLPTMLQSTGTLRYASPEQLRGAPPDPRDDVYALGVIAYQLLLGRLEAEVKGNWHKRLRADSVPDDLIELIGASTSDERIDRPCDAQEWVAALKGLLPGAAPRLTAPVPDLPPPDAERIHELTLERDEALRQVQRVRAANVGFFLPPRVPPDVAGYEFFARFSPAEVLGGDFHDFIPLAGGRVAVVIADVAGKGVVTSHMVATLSAEVRFCLLTVPNLAQAVCLLNERMIEGGCGDRFTTFVVLVIDPRTHAVTLVNAGHMSPKLVKAATGELVDAISLDNTGLPVGAISGYPFEQVVFSLERGDIVALFTDGVTDAMNPAGEMFGMGALEHVLATAERRAKRIGDRLLSAVVAHAAGRPPAYDLTVVTFGRGI